MAGGLDQVEHAHQPAAALLSTRDSDTIRKRIMPGINRIRITRYESPWEWIKRIENHQGFVTLGVSST